MSKKKKAGKKKGRLAFFGITARVGMLIAAGLLMLSYFSIIINPAQLWTVSLFGLLFVPLMALNVFLVFWALKRRSKSILIPLIAVLPAFFFIGRYFQIPGRQAESPEGEEDTIIKIVSYNVGRLAENSTSPEDRKRKLGEITEFLHRENADIICLQEFFCESEKDIKGFLKSAFKGYDAEYYLFPGSKGCFGNVTLSKMGAMTKGAIKFDESTNLAIYTDFVIGNDALRVYNCHFESYNISLSGIVKSIWGNDQDYLKDTEHKMKKGITRRPKQVNQVLSHISGCPVDAVVCGDFNDNPMSYSYYRLSKGRKDTFREAGEGFGATYSHLWPLLRIDYILCPDRCKALSHRTPRIKYSDHYPVVSELAI